MYNNSNCFRATQFFVPILLHVHALKTLVIIFHGKISTTSTNAFSSMEAFGDTEWISGHEKVKYHKKLLQNIPRGIYRRRCVRCRSVHSGSKDSTGSQTIHTSNSCSCHPSKRSQPTMRKYNHGLTTQLHNKENMSLLSGTPLTQIKTLYSLKNLQRLSSG